MELIIPTFDNWLNNVKYNGVERFPSQGQGAFRHDWLETTPSCQSRVFTWYYRFLMPEV